MKILVDADACPVVSQIEAIARKHHIPVILFCDTHHILHSTYSEVKTIGAGADAVDFALVNLCQAGDIAIMQNYGLAAMALSKQAYAMHSSGLQNTDENGAQGALRSGAMGYGDQRAFRRGNVLDGIWTP